jgi:hypothetical protein
MIAKTDLDEMGIQSAVTAEIEAIAVIEEIGAIAETEADDSIVEIDSEEIADASGISRFVRTMYSSQ